MIFVSILQNQIPLGSHNLKLPDWCRAEATNKTGQTLFWKPKRHGIVFRDFASRAGSAGKDFFRFGLKQISSRIDAINPDIIKRPATGLLFEANIPILYRKSENRI